MFLEDENDNDDAGRGGGDGNYNSRSRVELWTFLATVLRIFKIHTIEKVMG